MEINEQVERELGRRHGDWRAEVIHWREAYHAESVRRLKAHGYLRRFRDELKRMVEEIDKELESL